MCVSCLQTSVEGSAESQHLQIGKLETTVKSLSEELIKVCVCVTEELNKVNSVNWLVCVCLCVCVCVSEELVKVCVCLSEELINEYSIVSVCVSVFVCVLNSGMCMFRQTASLKGARVIRVVWCV